MTFPLFLVFLIIHVVSNDVKTTLQTGSTRTEFPCQVEFRGHTFQGEVELHGGSARGWPKKSYRVKFAKEDAPVIDFYHYDLRNRVHSEKRKVRDLVLKAEWPDGALMNDKLVHDLTLALGGHAPRSSYCEVKLNDEYQGLYCCFERVDDNFASARGWSEDATLYKAQSHDGDFEHTVPIPQSSCGTNCRIEMKSIYSDAVAANPVLTVRDVGIPIGGLAGGTLGGGSGFGYSQFDVTTPRDYDDLVERLRTTAVTFEAWEQNIQPLLDVPSVFSYNIAHVYAAECDGFDKNTYVYRDPSKNGLDGRFKLIGIDGDCAFRTLWNGRLMCENCSGGASCCNLIGIADGQQSTTDKLSRSIVNIPEYMRPYLTMFKRHIEYGVLTKEHVIGMISFLETTLQKSGAPERDAGKWPAPTFGDGNKRLDWAAAVARLKQNAEDRRNWFRNNLLGSQFAQLKSSLPGGGTCSSYDRCFTCNGETTGDPVSGDECLLAAGNGGVLIVSEIHGCGGAGDFIELKNIGPAPLDLSGWRIDGAVRFYFSPVAGSGQLDRTLNRLGPGEHFVLTRATSAATFQQQFPQFDVSKWRGTYAGRLQCSGERLAVHDTTQFPVYLETFDVAPAQRLRDPCGPIQSLNFDETNQLLAVDRPRFRGPMRTLVDSQSEQQAWIRRLPSPGIAAAAAADPCAGQPQPPNVVISEINANPTAGGTEWIELQLIDDADLTGWIVSDRDTSLDDVVAVTKQYKIPAGTTGRKGDFLLVQPSFRLSSQGEQLYLWTANGVLVDKVQFNASPPDQTLGRLNSLDSRLVILDQPTPRQANARQKESKFVITAVGFFPSFVRIQHIDGVMFAANELKAWQLRGAIDVDFSLAVNTNNNLVSHVIVYEGVVDVAVFQPFVGSTGLLVGPARGELEIGLYMDETGAATALANTRSLANAEATVESRELGARFHRSRVSQLTVKDTVRLELLTGSAAAAPAATTETSGSVQHEVQFSLRLGPNAVVADDAGVVNVPTAGGAVAMSRKDSRSTAWNPLTVQQLAAANSLVLSVSAPPACVAPCALNGVVAGSDSSKCVKSGYCGASSAGCVPMFVGQVALTDTGRAGDCCLSSNHCGPGHSCSTTILQCVATAVVQPQPSAAPPPSVVPAQCLTTIQDCITQCGSSIVTSCFCDTNLMKGIADCKSPSAPSAPSANSMPCSQLLVDCQEQCGTGRPVLQCSCSSLGQAVAECGARIIGSTPAAVANNHFLELAVGVAVGAIALVILFALLLVLWLRRRRQAQISESMFYGRPVVAGGASRRPGSQRSSRRASVSLSMPAPSKSRRQSQKYDRVGPPPSPATYTGGGVAPTSGCQRNLPAPPSHSHPSWTTASEFGRPFNTASSAIVDNVNGQTGIGFTCSVCGNAYLTHEDLLIHKTKRNH